MLAACCATCCVRECAPERGGARRRCLPFVASFGLSKFGLLQRSNDGWKVPSACAAICARRGAALGPTLHELRRHARSYFFLAVKPETTPTVASDAVAPRTSSQASGPRLGPVSLIFGDFAAQAGACALLPISAAAKGVTI